MKRDKKEKIKRNRRDPVYQKSIYDILGVSPDVLSDEVKIVVIGDYLIEFHNHNGIIDIADNYIKVNTKRNIYTVKGENLVICSMSDEHLDIKGKITALESE